MMAAVTRSRRGYTVAAVTAAAGLVAAGLLWFGLPVGGTLGQRFQAGQPMTVHLDDGRSYMIWTSDGAEPGCDVTRERETAPSDIELVREPDAPVRLNAAGETWRGIVLVRASPAGAHRLTCDTPGALGEPPWGSGARARVLTAVAALSLAGAGLFAGSLVALRVALRRRTTGTPRRSQHRDA
jgi:hypothetical protein